MQWLIDIIAEIVLEQLKGVIMLWSGAIVAIPDGWQICDGTNGTPDLRDKFIVGAGSTYDPGDAGGNTTHDHDFTANPHFHSLESGTILDIVYPAGDLHYLTTSTVATGTTDTENHLPPYYSLSYIMKL